MLSTSLLEILAITAVIVSVLAAVAAIRSARSSQVACDYARAIHEWMDDNSKRSIGLKKIAELQLAVTDHADLISGLYDGLKKLRSRSGMRELREKRKVDGSDLPDPKLDPEGWKKAMRLRLHRQDTTTRSHIDRGD